MSLDIFGAAKNGTNLENLSNLTVGENLNTKRRASDEILKFSVTPKVSAVVSLKRGSHLS